MTSHKRSTGLALIAVGVLVFAGTNAGRLPAAAFWPALAVCAIGLFSFVKANHVALEQAEERAHKAVHPALRNPTLESFAEKQAQTNGRALERLANIERHGVAAQATSPRSADPTGLLAEASPPEAPQEEIVLYDVDESEPELESNPRPESDSDQSGDHPKDDDFVITSDVSFPVELQERNALADQLEKLERLRDQGILSCEEFSLAKAKLLR